MRFESEARVWTVWVVDDENTHAYGVIQDMGFCHFAATCEDCPGETGYGLELGVTYSSKTNAQAALKRHYRKVHAEAVAR